MGAGSRGGGRHKTTPGSNDSQSAPDSGGIDALFSLEQLAYEAPLEEESSASVEFPMLFGDEPASSAGSGEIAAIQALDTRAITSPFEALDPGAHALPPCAKEPRCEAPPPPPVAEDDPGVSRSWTDTFDVDQRPAGGDGNPAAESRTWDDLEDPADPEDTLDQLSQEDSEGQLGTEDSLFGDDPFDPDAGDSLDWGESVDDVAGSAVIAPLAPVPLELREPPPREPTPGTSTDPAQEDDESISFYMEDEGPFIDDVPAAEAETVAAAMVMPALDEESADEESMGDVVQRGIDALHHGRRSEAMALFERALRSDPDDSVALTSLDVAHDLIIQEHLPGAGLEAVPRLRVGREMLMTLELDPQAGGVLAMVDGMTTIDELETMLPYFEREVIYRHLAAAIADGLIGFDD
jgi:hypothetical protein